MLCEAFVYGGLLLVGIGGAAAWLLAGTGSAAAAASIYLATLAGAACRRKNASAPGPGRHRLVVIVPAHNEAELVGRAIASLRTQTYPAHLYRIVVVADNCTDDTAAIAEAAGAEVMVRNEPALRGKGRALRWGMDRLLDGPQAPDAVVIVDADSLADRGLLEALVARMDAGADAVQAEYLVLSEPGTGSELRQAAFLLFHHTRFTGRDVLGLPCSLVGNGMLLRSSLLARVPWSAFSGVEDLEYSMILRLAGVKPRYAAAAGVAGPASDRGRAARIQRLRWEGGRFHVIRTRLPALVATAVRNRDWSLLDAAADLAIPPLGLLVLITLGGGALTAAAWSSQVIPLWPLATWTVAAAGTAVYVLLGLRAANAPSSAYRALLGAPRFLVAKVGTYLRLTRGLRAESWMRTERPGESRQRNPRRVDICGVPIDVVTLEQAVDRAVAAALGGRFLQVCTINLQFLVSARRLPRARDVLRHAGLNVADGAPVVWLARLMGWHLPGRVAGADLVPALMARAAAVGARVFLLGGTDSVTARAAAELSLRYPTLVISGTFEPAVTPLHEMDDEAILARVEKARPDILLVGFGHPKQDLWIAKHRDRLRDCVAIGVGCTLDLIAGRVSRAPAWVRRPGFEWLFRLIREPRRLAPRYAMCALWLVGVLTPVAAWHRLVGGATEPSFASEEDGDAAGKPGPVARRPVGP